ASSGPPPSAAATRRGGPIAGTATSLSELAADGWHVSSANADDQIPDAWAALLTSPGYATAGRA
ncbi:MAG: hypothetical protein JWN61_1711, partial [Pseudonocardiales bacterium]|nr:hypothetical protein [Pseudonocardiales bacterium]